MPLDKALACLFWFTCSSGARDNGEDSSGDGSLQYHHEPHRVATKAEGVHHGNAGVAIGHAGGEDKVHGIDHEA
jgi:hypothetical protein